MIGRLYRSLRVRAFVVTVTVAVVALALYDRRYELPRLAMIVLPCAAMLGWWLGWRMVRPIERLRAQALAQVEALTPGADLELPRSDELGDLAGAFNRLLAELRTRRAEKEAFVADLAHEFRNPVAAIRTAAEALGSGRTDPDRLSRLSTIILDSSRRLDGLVAQFVELARAEAGLREEAREPVDVSALAAAIVDRFAADERFARVRFTTALSTAAVVRGVAQGLETALANLVENAASFAGDTGHVDVRVSASDAVELVVEDDGPGIAEEDLPRVFDRFFTKRASGRGMGLGLALVRAIVQAHAGRVDVRSVRGRGTAFTVRLPLDRG